MGTYLRVEIKWSFRYGHHTVSTSIVFKDYPTKNFHIFFIIRFNSLTTYLIQLSTFFYQSQVHSFQWIHLIIIAVHAEYT